MLEGMESGTLRTWKEIATYLAVSESTVRRWHRDYELPVNRSVGKRVFSTRNLVDRWVLAWDVRQRRSAEAD